MKNREEASTISDRPPPAAVYRRRVAASLERVWENVLDWEHLPWLHRGSFGSIDCLEAGAWGWRARVGMAGGIAGDASLVELRVEREALRYVAHSIDGPASGMEVWTQLDPRSQDATEIEVSFHLPTIPRERAVALGRGMVQVYTRLWDEDEAMMVEREAALARSRAPRPARPDSIDLGSSAQVRSCVPFSVEVAGRSYRVVELDGELFAHAATCPHWLGPLGAPDPESGELQCPWHGYRFDARSGRSCDGRKLHLDRAPRIALDTETDRVRLHF